MTVDEHVTVLALVEGESCVRDATVVHRDPALVHIDTESPLPLPVGDVVGLVLHASGDTVALALVAESIGPTVTALRILERRG